MRIQDDNAPRTPRVPLASLLGKMFVKGKLVKAARFRGRVIQGRLTLVLRKGLEPLLLRNSVVSSERLFKNFKKTRFIRPVKDRVIFPTELELSVDLQSSLLRLLEKNPRGGPERTFVVPSEGIPIVSCPRDLGVYPEYSLAPMAERIAKERHKQRGLLATKIQAIMRVLETEVLSRQETTRLFMRVKGLKRKAQTLEALIQDPVVKTPYTNTRKSTRVMERIRSVEYQGTRISFGRNQNENSALFRKYSRSNPDWQFLHAKYYSGCTVIVHTPDPSPEILDFAAKIAAMYSSAWSSLCYKLYVSCAHLRDVRETTVPARYNLLSAKTLTIDVFMGVPPTGPVISPVATPGGVCVIPGVRPKELYRKAFERVLGVDRVAEVWRVLPPRLEARLTEPSGNPLETS